MNSRFKFPRRVRIHGGECGAVARALHHEAQKEALMEHELSFLSQAESEKFFDSTLNERKQMSTKTSMKRIALLAVSALGFGLLSVMPANAAVLSLTAPTAVNNVNNLAIAAAATDKRVDIGFTAPIAAIGDTWSATITLTRPTGSAVTLSDRNGAVADGVGAGGAAYSSATATPATGAAATLSNISSSGLSGTVSGTIAAAVAAPAAVSAGALLLRPDVMGTYTVRITTPEGLTASVSFHASLPFGVTGAVFGAATGNNTSTVAATQVAGANNFVSVVASVDAPAVTAATDYDVVTVSGSTIVNSVGFSATSPLNSSTVRVKDAGLATGAVSATGNDQIWVSAATAGTITVTYSRRTFSAGVATDTVYQTITITVGSNALDAAKSTAYLGSGTTASAAADATVAPVSFAATGPVANISYNFVNLLGTAFALTSPALSATITGPGLIAAGTVAGGVATCPAAASNGAAKVISVTPPTGAVCIYADGTSGEATISILAGGTVWSTKKVTFFGPATAFKVDSTTSSTLGAGKLAAALGVGDQNWWDLSTVDASGNTVSATPALTVTIADTTILSNVSDVTGIVKVQGVKAGTTTFTVTSGTVTLAPVTVIVSEKTATSATMTLDKSAYQTGEAFTLTIDAKDSGGRALADATYNGMATLTTNVLVPGVAGTPIALGNPTFVNGKATLSGFMPATTGSVTFTLTLGAAGTPGVATAAAGAVLKASAEVSSAAISAADAAADAAAEAIDAANAATDAANLAAEAADAATVAAEEARDAADAATAAVEELASQVAALFAALKAQLTTLANTVAKIAKKVKA